ncbi:MAG: hypothetical protein SAL07_10640 [Oscillatoria sp. PMC 1051.18]|nr:hypothetical protein [Oscillatoria sp. PMC 1050.18]MEC5030361.1 hypothetical protein [Oscillatoria sp. PMC 1051.18]
MKWLLVKPTIALIVSFAFGAISPANAYQPPDNIGTPISTDNGGTRTTCTSKPIFDRRDEI